MFTGDSNLLEAIATLAFALLTILLGLVVLWRGRRLPWLLSGAAAFLLGLLAVRILNVLLGNSADSTDTPLWENLIPVVAAFLGVLAGRFRIAVAYELVGAATGGALAIWIARLFLPPDVGLDFWSVAFILLGMVLGVLFVTRYGDVALIVLSAVVGPALILHGLSLPPDSGLVATLALAAGIAGLVIQYHDYLVELRLAHRNKTPLDGITGPAPGEAGTTDHTALPAG